jgi:DNA mismatch repair ATPase MutS
VVASAAWSLIESRRSRYRAWRLKRFYERGLQRVNGEWAGGGITGEEFAEAGHPYAADLNLFGEGSLFELLCISRTSIGERGLANFLLETPTLDETQFRQDAVRELRGRLDLREKAATLGEFEFCESKWATFDDWLKAPVFSYPRFLPVLAAVTSSLLAGLILAVFAGVAWTKVAIFIWPLIGLHAIIGAYFRHRTSRMLAEVRPLSTELQVLRQGLDLLESERFKSAKLRSLVDQIQHASSSLKKLERLVNAIHQRDKEWFFLPSRALLVGTQLCPAIAQWRRQHGEPLRLWIEAWAEFEALNALAAYAYESPDHPFPDLSDGKPCFEARGLAHPLLPRESIANDVQLNPRAPFYIVSGSNMSGKSTLLRSIGLNAVLAYAGAPVRANALRLSGLSIFASLSLVDSLLNGKSKFLVEVNRLKQAIESVVENRSVLFLVDEIFSGTNSHDRRLAAEAVVRTLVDRGGIGALSTHDLALTEIAGAVNVHMGSRDESDPLDFDYVLKPGVTREANALAIARMAGVPV